MKVYSLPYVYDGGKSMIPAAEIGYHLYIRDAELDIGTRVFPVSLTIDTAGGPHIHIDEIDGPEEHWLPLDRISGVNVIGVGKLVFDEPVYEVEFLRAVKEGLRILAEREQNP